MEETPYRKHSHWDDSQFPSTPYKMNKIPDLRWVNKKNIALVFTEEDKRIPNVVLVTAYLLSSARVDFITDKETLSKELDND